MYKKEFTINKTETETKAKLITPNFLRASASLRDVILNYPKLFLRASVPPCEILLPLYLCASASLRDIIGDNQ